MKAKRAGSKKTGQGKPLDHNADLTHVKVLGEEGELGRDDLDCKADVTKS